MAKKQQPATGHLPFPWATMDDAIKGGQHIYAMLSGEEPRDALCLANCAMPIISFGLSLIPHDGPIMQAGPATEEALKTALAPPGVPNSAQATADASALPWAQIALIALELLRTWMQNR